jgi:SAM-dependent methyltransferase
MAQCEGTGDGQAGSPLDPTFRQYSLEQASSYARHRHAYSPGLYQVIIDYHTAGAGQFDTLLDVGCGTGGATRDLARYFERATGADPGQSMIAQARSIGGQTRSGGLVAYEVLGGEDLTSSNTVPAGSVDVLTAAMAVRLYNLSLRKRSAIANLLVFILGRHTGSRWTTFGGAQRPWLSLGAR